MTFVNGVDIDEGITLRLIGIISVEGDSND